MGQVLHGSARTTEAVRRAIQRSEESVRALARRHGISPTTKFDSLTKVSGDSVDIMHHSVHRHRMGEDARQRGGRR